MPSTQQLQTLSLCTPVFRFSILQQRATKSSSVLRDGYTTGAGKQHLEMTLMNEQYTVKNTLNKGSERLFFLFLGHKIKKAI